MGVSYERDTPLLCRVESCFPRVRIVYLAGSIDGQTLWSNFSRKLACRQTCGNRVDLKHIFAFQRGEFAILASTQRNCFQKIHPTIAKKSLQITSVITFVASPSRSLAHSCPDVNRPTLVRSLPLLNEKTHPPEPFSRPMPMAL